MEAKMSIVMLALTSVTTGAAVVSAYMAWKRWREGQELTTTEGFEPKKRHEAKVKTAPKIWIPGLLMVVSTGLSALFLSLFLRTLSSPLPDPVPGPRRPEITWLNPASGAEVGWKTTVTLRSRTATEKVTILVRPHSGERYYVQHGAAPLSANTPQSFEIQLAGGRQQEIGTEFDIVAVCSDGFEPNQWSLDASDVPHSSVVGRITVVKAAGNIRLAPQQRQDEGLVRVEGKVWAPNGAALLVREEQAFKVLETLPSSPTGSQFSKGLSVPASRRNAIYLVVYKMNSPAVLVGQKIWEIPPDSYWLYGPAK